MPTVDEVRTPRKPRTRTHRVQARALPSPPLGVWVVLGILLAMWGLWTLRPRPVPDTPPTANPGAEVIVPADTDLVPDPSSEPSSANEPAGAAQDDQPELEPIPSITQLASSVPSADGGTTNIELVQTSGPTSSDQPESYTVAAGDTMGNIAARFEVPLEALMEINGLTDPNLIHVGQVLALPTSVEFAAPFQRILPDSEIILSPAYKGFSVREFVEAQDGFLAAHQEEVEGETLSGIEIVERVSLRYSVGPRPLLAMLEYHSGWVTEREPDEKVYPLGLEDPLRSGLFFQLSWAANRLNEGYYNRYGERDLQIRFKDGTRALLDSRTNPGTAGVQNAFAANHDPEQWSRAVGDDGFLATYLELFGDPWARSVEPLVPDGLTQPALRLPWSSGETWYYTGGPHGGWGDLSAWAALDFVPADNTGCGESSYWATAAAAGKIIRSENGEVVIDLDGDGFVGTGWTLLYMHIGSTGRIARGTTVDVGDRIGRPSCEGGFSDAAHLHIARRYNGQWMNADGQVPFVLGGWQAQGGSATYDGYLARQGESREACACREDELNGITAR